MDPWGEERADLRMAMLTSLVASYLTRRAHSAAEFMPYSEKPVPIRQQSLEEMKAAFKGFAQSVEKRAKRHG